MALALDAVAAFLSYSGGVHRVSRMGGNARMLSKASTGAAVAVDAAYVYFADAAGIARVAK